MISKSDLAQFTGTEQWFRHSICRGVLYTEGVKYLAGKAGAYWLIDKIAILQLVPHIRGEEFQAWTLVLQEGSTAKLSCDDGDGTSIYSEEISFTDFPLSEIVLWFVNDTILLPSEY